MRWRLALLSLICLVFTLRAQDDELPPDEVADIVDRYLERAEDSLREGNYEEARLRFKKALRRDKNNITAHLGTARCWAVYGSYEKAENQLKALLAAHPSNRAAKVQLAELALARGQSSQAAELAKGVIKSASGEGPDLEGLQARLVVAETLARRGQRGDARTVLDAFPAHYKARLNAYSVANQEAEEWVRQPEKARPMARELVVVGKALRMYVELSPLDHEYAQTAYELVTLAKDIDPSHWEAWVELVRISRVDRERAIGRARKTFTLISKRNPDLADLYVETAKTELVGFSDGRARKLCEDALRINPKLTDAHAIVARVMLQDNEYPRAAEQIEKGLAIDAFHRQLLTLKATYELLNGRRDAFEKGMAEVLRIDPKFGEGFHIAAQVVASRQRRYDTASKLVRRGLKIDPHNFEAHATLGVFLANDGRAEEARDALQRSQKLFPFSHPIRNNFLQVLEYVTNTMTTHKTKNFTFRFDPAEHEIMSMYLPELMEGCWDDMVKRYEFTPRRPILVETFRKADDFSVRTLGLPGIPALGACFGGLITLDSPQALRPGAFLWSSTARHEFAHVMSLQLSGGQVPRWFTEGLSVLEEKPLDVSWGKEDNMERQIFDAYHTKTLPKIGRFDAMFRGPRVGFAYYIGGLMLEFLQERAGEAGIVKALRLYGKDVPMRRVFRESFNIGLDEFDKAFAEHIGKRMAPYAVVPSYGLQIKELRKAVVKDKKDGESLIRLAWAYYQSRRFVDAGDYLDRAQRELGAKHRLVMLLSAHVARRTGRGPQARKLLEQFIEDGHEDYDARMLLASAYLQEGATEKYVATLKAAKKAWPFRVSGNNPYALLRRHYMSVQDEPAALRELEAAMTFASKDIKGRLGLSAEYIRLGRDKDAITTLEQALGITLFDVRMHTALLPLYRKAGAKKKAVRTARVRVALRDAKTSELELGWRWIDLAEVLAEDDQAAEATKALNEAIKLGEFDDEPRVNALKEKLGQ